MSMADKLIAEFDREMPPTRKLLDRVPGDKGRWKPHPKSFALGHLAQLVSDMPGWLTRIAHGEDIDLSSAPPYDFHPTEKLLENFDRNVREARAALAKFKDADYAIPWSLRAGDKVLFTDERGMVIRQTINHFSHHRGQLTVYLRCSTCRFPRSMARPPTKDGAGPTRDNVRRRFLRRLLLGREREPDVLIRPASGDPTETGLSSRGVLEAQVSSASVTHLSAPARPCGSTAAPMRHFTCLCSCEQQECAVHLVERPDRHRRFHSLPGQLARRRRG